MVFYISLIKPLSSTWSMSSLTIYVPEIYCEGICSRRVNNDHHSQEYPDGANGMSAALEHVIGSPEACESPRLEDRGMGNGLSRD